MNYQTTWVGPGHEAAKPTPEPEPTTVDPVTTADPDVESTTTSRPTTPPTQASTSPTEDTPTTQGSLRHHASYFVIVLLACLPLIFSQ